MRKVINRSNKSHNAETDGYKKMVVSFQVDRLLWRDFDMEVEESYGKYKKSLIIESLIRKYMAKNNKDNNKEKLI